MFKIRELSTQRLLQNFSDILDELKSRGVVRTRNNPLADYCEWLVSQKIHLKLEANSKSGFDAVDEVGTRYQVKCRRLDPSHNSRQLGVIRNLGNQEFDYLIGIIFTKDFNVQEAYKIPWGLIQTYARYSEHQNGHILQLRGEVLKDHMVENITNLFR